MDYQSIFKRYELKYLVSYDEKQRLLSKISKYLENDQYAHSSIRNIYFDTPNYRLIRRSIEKPDYKEKIRIRSYGKISDNDKIFIEIKKKYDSVVYKRRTAMNEDNALSWISGESKYACISQIENEIDYFIHFYKPLLPAVYLSYERDSFFSPKERGFRLTFDTQICARTTELSLKSDPGGVDLMPKDLILMEVKCTGGIPLWLVKALTEERIYKTSFSKYGTAYTKLIFPNTKGDT